MNPALRMYMMTQADEREAQRDSRPEYTGAESRYMDPRLPEQNEPEEMSRRRDSNGRYMTDYDGGAESRYRGRDGRWKSGTRRSEYDGGAEENDYPNRRMGDDEEDDDMQDNVIRWPYGPEPDMPTENRVIGFGTRDSEYQTRGHYDDGMGQRQAAQVGGTMWMEPINHHGEMKMDRETAEKWMRTMRNEDSARPTGARWSMDELKPMAQKFGIKPDSEEFYEFAVMTNAMYSDYCGVAKKFNITSPEYYGLMALAWMRDKDAMPNKTAMYYQYIVKK